MFDKLCTWLETELEHSLFTLEQLHQKMNSIDKSPDKSLVYSKKHLRNMLVDRYQEKMYFTSQERRTGVLCFKDMNASIIREYYDNSQDDGKTINTAVKLVNNNVSLLGIYRSVYHSVTMVIDPDRQLELAIVETTFKSKYSSCLLGKKPDSTFKTKVRSGSITSMIRSTIRPPIRF